MMKCQPSPSLLDSLHLNITSNRDTTLRNLQLAASRGKSAPHKRRISICGPPKCPDLSSSFPSPPAPCKSVFHPPANRSFRACSHLSSLLQASKQSARQSTRQVIPLRHFPDLSPREQLSILAHLPLPSVFPLGTQHQVSTRLATPAIKGVLRKSPKGQLSASSGSS